MRRSFVEPGIIDLGEIGTQGYELDRPLSKGSRRTLTAAITALFCLLALGSSVPGSPVLEQLWTGEVSLAGFTVGPAVVIMSEPGASAIMGRDLWTGQPRWQLDLDSTPEYTADTGDGTSAVVMMGRDAQTGDFALTTTLVDPSGRALVTVPGYQLDPVGSGGLLLVVAALPTVGCAGEAEPCSDVPALDRTTGREVWRHRMPGSLVRAGRSSASTVVAGSAAASFTGSFATVRRDGRVDVRDLATGSVVDSVSPVAVGQWDVVLFDGSLVTATRGLFGATLTAYRLNPLRRAWSVTVPVSDVVTDSTARFYLAGCGEFICLHADGANAVIEPATGRLRGQVGVDVIGQVGDMLLARPSAERPSAERQSSARDDAGNEVYLLDAADGQRFAAMADSVVVRWRDSGGSALVAQQGLRRTAFTIWDARRHAHPLGSVAGADLTCEARSVVLICADPGGTLRAWRLPV